MDPRAPTRPTPVQTVPVRRAEPPAAGVTQPHRPSAARRPSHAGRARAALAGAVFGLLLAAVLLAPFRTTVLLMGIDRAPEGTALGRSDTLVLLTILPLQGYSGMLSIPRDLWVRLPGGGQGRINAAHALAESARPGSGARATLETVRDNFGLRVHGSLRVRLEGVVEIVDALGGVRVELEAATGGLPAGVHTLDGPQALAFARQRAGADDFVRMRNGQLLLRALLRRSLEPAAWLRLPAAAAAAGRAIDSDLAPWDAARLALALARAGPDGMDARVITREMVEPFTTDGGAQVLRPRWERINPLLLEMFGQ